MEKAVQKLVEAMSEADFYINRLKEVDKEKWPSIWLSLLVYKWPDELGSAPKSEDAVDVIRTLRLEIECVYTLKTLYRSGFLLEDKNARRAFEDWWNSQGAWWISGSPAEAKLKSIVSEAVAKELSNKQLKKGGEKCAEKSTKSRGEKLRSTLFLTLFHIFGSFLGVLLALLFAKFCG